jgi:hypothetical protein
VGARADERQRTMYDLVRCAQAARWSTCGQA